ncbi:MAG: HD-GYP domain-containing protein [Patescibacteria group bacterium]
MTDLSAASRKELIQEISGLRDRIGRLESILKAIDFPEVLIEYWDDTIGSFLAVMQIIDPTTADHQKCVSKLARQIALTMNLSAGIVTSCQMSGLTHDIGKLAVPTRFLTKPNTLDPHEFNCIVQHTVAGHQILRGIKWPWPVANVALQHHEKMDGSGYPHKLKGEQACLEARIVAVADVVHAMCSRRPYREAMSLQQAFDEISTQAGIRLYQPAVHACLHAFKDGFSFGQLSSNPN